MVITLLQIHYWFYIISDVILSASLMECLIVLTQLRFSHVSCERHHTCLRMLVLISYNLPTGGNANGC